MKKVITILCGFIISILALGTITFAQSRGTLGSAMMGSNNTSSHGHGGYSEYFSHEGHEMEDNLILPQIAVGDNYSTNIILLNMGNPEQMPWMSVENLTTTGKIYFYAQDGTRLPVSINRNPPTTEISFSLDSMMTASYKLTSMGPVTSGWALIVFEDNLDWGWMDDHEMRRGHQIMASAFYTYMEGSQVVSRVGVMPSVYEIGHFSRSMTSAYFQDELYTGVAIVNSGAETATIQLHLKDTNGQIVGTRQMFMSAGNQMALYIHELFDRVPSGFQGFLEVEADKEGVVMMGMLFSQGIFTSVPTMHYGGFTSMMP